MRTKNKTILFSFVVLVLVSLSCNKGWDYYFAQKDSVHPQVKIVNTVSNLLSPVDFYINNIKVTGAKVAYPGLFPSTGYFKASSNTFNVKAIIPGTAPNPDVTVFTKDITATPPSYYTVFLFDEIPNVQTLVITDSSLVPPADSGKVYVRLVNVVKNSSPLKLVNVTVPATLDTVINNIPYKSVSPFVKTNSGTALSFQLYNAGTNTKVGAVLKGQTLTGNRIYTFYASGKQGGVGIAGPTLSLMTTQ